MTNEPGRRWRVTVDRDRCVGAAHCLLSVPELLDQSDEDGRVVLLAQPDDERTSRAARLAADACPSGALQVDPVRDDRGT